MLVARRQLAAIRKEQEKQKLAEEAARLKKIAEEMEAARAFLAPLRAMRPPRPIKMPCGTI